MMVHEPAGVVFLGHVKHASRNTYRELEHHGFRLVGWRHMNPRDLCRTALHWTPEFTAQFGPIKNLAWWERIGGWDRPWRFVATLRDPWAFLLTLYCWNPLGERHPLQGRIPLQWAQTLHTRFARFLPRPGRLWRFTYAPGCWRVLVLERLEADLAQLLADIGQDPTLRFLPRTDDLLETRTPNKPAGDPRRWFAPDTARYIRRTYAEDLELYEHLLQQEGKAGPL